MCQPQQTPKRAEEHSGKKSIEELENWLKERLDVQQIPLTSFTEFFVSQLWNWAANHAGNENTPVDPDKFQFVCYRLLDTARNAEYNQYTFCTHEPYIYVIFEKTADYLYSNCTKLDLELFAERGYSDADRRNNTFRFRHYEMCAGMLERHEY